MYTGRIEVSESALSHNLRLFRSIIGPEIMLCAVVKSNAYGHGMKLVAGLALKQGADLLAVNCLDEAMELKEAFPSANILIMGQIEDIKKYRAELSYEKFWIVVSRSEDVATLSSFSPMPRIHLKTDTGMGRLGFSGKKGYEVIDEIRSKKLPLHGLLSHFASAEDFTEHSYSRLQLSRFMEYKEYTKKVGYENLIYHTASSASTLLFPQARQDMVRIGISMYGLWPSDTTRYSMALLGHPEPELKPVLSWKTGIAHVQEVSPGSYIGYGSTYRMNYAAKIAVLPVGYYEGYNRRLSNQSYVLIRNQRAYIIGRVCMNMCMADVSHIPGVSPGDDVVLIGRAGEEEVSADLLAGLSGSINYDIVTGINAKIPRYII
ncbi:MAG: alanine racemase [Leptospiraceae bacterium]|nr:alanine racemase [Leptospiraceae bacterium]MCP5502870.1 alanine racemase [Leptospiraceae bacterium]